MLRGNLFSCQGSHKNLKSKYKDHQQHIKAINQQSQSKEMEIHTILSSYTYTRLQSAKSAKEVQGIQPECYLRWSTLIALGMADIHVPLRISCFITFYVAPPSDQDFRLSKIRQRNIKKTFNHCLKVPWHAVKIKAQTKTNKLI